MPKHTIDKKLWVRIPAQVYNELSDYEVLAEALKQKAVIPAQAGIQFSRQGSAAELGFPPARG